MRFSNGFLLLINNMCEKASPWSHLKYCHLFLHIIVQLEFNKIMYNKNFYIMCTFAMWRRHDRNHIVQSPPKKAFWKISYHTFLPYSKIIMCHLLLETKSPTYYYQSTTTHYSHICTPNPTKHQVPPIHTCHVPLWALIYPPLVSNHTQPGSRSNLSYGCLSVNPLCLLSNGSFFLTFLNVAGDNGIAPGCENVVWLI